MFRNIGKKVKVLAIIFMILNLVCTVGSAALVLLVGGRMISFEAADEQTAALLGTLQNSYIFIAVGILIVGILVSILIAWFQYALGVAADEAENAAITAEGIADRLEQLCTALTRRPRPQQQQGYPQQQNYTARPQQVQSQQSAPQTNVSYAQNSYAPEVERTRRTRSVHTDSAEQ